MDSIYTQFLSSFEGDYYIGCNEYRFNLSVVKIEIRPSRENTIKEYNRAYKLYSWWSLAKL